MIICVCKAVSDKHIRAAVAEGAGSLHDLTRELQVGTRCGKCLPHAQAALSACVAQCNGHAQRAGGVTTRTGNAAKPVFFAEPAAEYAT